MKLAGSQQLLHCPAHHLQFDRHLFHMPSLRDSRRRHFHPHLGLQVPGYSYAVAPRLTSAKAAHQSGVVQLGGSAVDDPVSISAHLVDRTGFSQHISDLLSRRARAACGFRDIRSIE